MVEIRLDQSVIVSVVVVVVVVAVFVFFITALL